MLHYIERGKGEPLILLHGNGEDSGYFDRQMGPFSCLLYTSPSPRD